VEQGFVEPIFAEGSVRGMSGYGICWSANLFGFQPNRGKADMSGVLLASLSGEVLGPQNRAMTFLIDAQGVH
jgi:hypothetical protein